jgi:hypothetical protein
VILPGKTIGTYRKDGRVGALLLRYPVCRKLTEETLSHHIPPEVDPEDLRKHGDKAVRLADDLAPGEVVRWADLVNTAASMADIEDGPGK